MAIRKGLGTEPLVIAPFLPVIAGPFSVIAEIASLLSLLTMTV